MTRDFKDKLVQNKWLTYQTNSSLSLMNEYDNDEYNLILTRNESLEKYLTAFEAFHSKYRFTDKFFNCSQHHCMKSSYQYHKLSDTSRRSNNRKKVMKLKYDHFKNRKLTKNSTIKEHIWYNLKNKDSIIISGNYSESIENEIIKYFPNMPNSLKLNDIPVSYIEISIYNKDIIDMECHLLYFCFDITSYCDIIDCIIILNKKKNRNNYFFIFAIRYYQVTY
jgi:hypothetical protein